MEPPEEIICVDCGGPCSIISYEPDEGWSDGAVVAYRCRDCNDRWDMVIESSEDDSHHPPD